MEEGFYEQQGHSEQAEESEPAKKKDKPPALTINIQSWWTPIVGLVLLVVGLAAGYFAYPMITDEAPAEAGGSTSVESQAQAPEPTTDPAQRQQLMDFLVPQVLHFKGDESAPVTLIEFSDFQ